MTEFEMRRSSVRAHLMAFWKALESLPDWRYQCQLPSDV